MNKLTLKSVFTPFFLLIFSAVFLSTVSDQWITKKVEMLVSSKDGLTGMIWFWGGLSLASAILFPMLIAILCSYSIVRQMPEPAEPLTKNENAGDDSVVLPAPVSSPATPILHSNPLHFFTENIELSIIENLRSWGKGFLWSFVFIFPGIWKFIMYTLTPYVVLFSKKYKLGQVDALDYSTVICKKHWKPVNLWLTVFYMAIPILVYMFFEDYRLISNTPISATLLVFFRTLCEYTFHFLMLKIFINHINQFEIEPVPEKETKE